MAELLQCNATEFVLTRASQVDFAKIIPIGFADTLKAAHALPALERETLASDIFVDDRRFRDRSIWAMALALAVTLHVGVLVAATSFRGDRVGAGGVDIDAVSVEVSIISIGALESRATERDKASGAAGRVDLRDGAVEPELETAEATTSASKKKTQDQFADDETIQDTKIAIPEPPHQSKAPRPIETPPVAPSGGSAALAIDNLLPTPASGAAAASVGEVQAYSVNVVEILAKSRPRADAGLVTGTVLVAFEIAATGTPANVRVSKSSGKLRIDRMVVDAIQATTFPPPPANATLAQRSYELPYVFR